MSSHEHTPLLTSSSTQTTNKLQLFLILLGRLGEATTFTVIFPFAEFLTVVPWTKLSDKIGRKPVQIIALSAVTIAAPCFGLSHNLIGMLVSRAIAGGFNGNIAVSKTAIIENTSESSRAYVFSLEPVAWVLGSILGPWLGGYLSKPAERWPHIFGHIPIFVNNPYFLPCLAAALIPGSIALMSAIFLKETLHTISEKRPTSQETRQFEGPTSPLLRGSSLSDDENDDINCCPSHQQEEEHQDNYYDYEAGDGDENRESLARAEKTQNFKKCQTRFLIAASALLAFASMAFVVLAPLMAYTPISSGGLSLNPSQIGTSLSLSRLISLVIVNMVIFPWIQQIAKSYRIFQFQLMCYPLLSALYPLLNVVAAVSQKNLRGNENQDVPTIACLCALQVLQSLSDCSFVSSILILRQLVQSSNEFNGTNAHLQSIICLVRSFAPPLSTVIFAVSTQTGIIHGFGVWIFLGLVSLVLFLLGLCIRDPEIAKYSTLSSSLYEDE